MIGLIRVVSAVALLVAMGLISLVYADTFSPAAASAGGTVTLSGQAKPNSSMSGYFSCDSGCGQKHIGVAPVNAQGWYSLTFKIPADAKPGGAFVDIGCDRCGNNWRRVGGLQISATAASPNNGLSSDKKQQLAQVGVQLSTVGRKVLTIRDQVVRSVGANNAKQVDSILNSQEMQATSNNLVVTGDQMSESARRAQFLGDGEINSYKDKLNNLKSLRDGLQAKLTQINSSIKDEQKLIDAKQPELNKQTELQRFWYADMQQHQRNSDDAQRRCQPPFGKMPDVGACGYWPQEAAQIKISATKNGIAAAAVATIQAQILPIQINMAIEGAVRDMFYQQIINTIDSQINEARRGLGS